MAKNDGIQEYLIETFMISFESDSQYDNKLNTSISEIFDPKVWPLSMGPALLMSQSKSRSMFFQSVMNDILRSAFEKHLPFLAYFLEQSGIVSLS